jgi:NAD(P)-dependent dehydrogenase (short-subunit alcohol dehydrogenase family)
VRPLGPARFRVVWGDPFHALAQELVDAHDVDEALVTAGERHPELPRPRVAFLVTRGDDGALPYTSTMTSLFDVSGKVVLVTGGSRGIGEMIARGFVEAGAKVYISSRKADVCEALAAELSSVGECVAIPADLSSEAECRRLADEIAAREERLDVLVNNAGATWGAPMAEYDEAAFERVFALNVKGVFHLTKFLRPLLERSGTPESPARVINIGSIDAIHVPIMETYAYSASKAAVHQLTRHLAKQMAPLVTVNAIAPGPFVSKMMRATLEAFGDEIAKNAPMRRIGQASDMAGAAIFLASPAASYITGAILPVDGGIATLG